jgi:hypothetical protein
MNVNWFIKNRKPFFKTAQEDVHINQSSKMMSNCSNLKAKPHHLLYIPETTESKYAVQKYPQILFNPSNCIGHTECKHE